MSVKKLKGTLVFNKLVDKDIIDLPETFTTLDELFTNCLAGGEKEYIDRVTIRGEDETGKEREIHFSFTSLSF